MYFFFSLVLIVLTSLGTFEIIKRTDLFKLEKIKIIGDSEELNFHLEQDLSRFVGINLYKLDLETMKDTVKNDYPLVKDVKINRRILNKIKVRYWLENPFVIINFSDGKNYYATRELKLLERVNYGYLQESLPVISTKLNSQKYKIGAVVRDSTTHVIADYLSEILVIRPDFQDKISDVFSKDDKIYFREIFRGNIVYLGNDNIDEKVDLFMSHFSSFASGLFIDVSFKNQIVTSKAEF